MQDVNEWKQWADGAGSYGNSLYFLLSFSVNLKTSLVKREKITAS